MGKDYGEKIEGGYYSDANHCYRNDAGVVIPSVTGIFEALG